MKTIINIGTNMGNIQNVPFEKEYDEITTEDIFKIVKEKFPHPNGGSTARINGWCDVTHKHNQNK